MSDAKFAAILLLVGTLAAAVITSWDKLRCKPATETIPTDSAIVSKPSPKPNPSGGGTTKPVPEPTRPAAIEEIKDIVLGKVVDAAGNEVENAKIRCLDCLSDEATISSKTGSFRLPFRVKKSDDPSRQEINLSVEGYPHPFSIRVLDPSNRVLRLQ